MSTQYHWTKGYMVRTSITDPVQAGDVIVVADRNGGSVQKVLSVTVMTSMAGNEYKALLLQAAARPAETGHAQLSLLAEA
jgi:hypothetical protein